MTRESVTRFERDIAARVAIIRKGENPPMRLSKSRYVTGLQCLKIPWMDKHMPEQFDELVWPEHLIKAGNEVGDLAMGYYGDCVEVSFDPHDFEGMAVKTREPLDAGDRIIYEDNFCMADILLVEDDGMCIVEAKATNEAKDYHLDDVSYQLWVIERCGLKVKSASLMHLNREYQRKGDIDLHKLFVVEDITEEARMRAESVPANNARITREADVADESEARVGSHCGSPHECGYRAWCLRELLSPSVFGIKRIGADKAAGLAHDQGIVSMRHVHDAGVHLNALQSMQVLCEVDD